MKIHINKIKITPPDLGFNFCVFGEPTNEILEWCNYWNLITEKSGQYTNIILSDNFSINDTFDSPTQYEYIDGFSPNLNKKLHVGHLSNLV